ncbi:serine hydrolase [Phormidium sp. CCY1219]|uniref:serine hydrolase n=1 Tax=Phormidium sp. CCY1219 TaxID=2886104 RepID=UPI002D78614C|nr:serine hydrolase [Phormidium sp. CCY1219]
MYGARLLILGVGLGVLAGTFFSVWNPAKNFTADASRMDSESVEQPDTAAIAPTGGLRPGLHLSSEMSALKSQIETLVAEQSDLTPGVFVVDLDSSAYLDINGTMRFSAASTIKTPILIAFFQDIDAGKISLDETLTMKAEHVASGSGDMQYSEPGTQYSALETAIKMIAISDNTATNMLIERLGGAAALNRRFLSWGLTATQISNPLPDLEGTNTTSPRDLVQLMAMVEKGKLVSLRSRDRLLGIMESTVNDALLPQGLDAEATIAHKTGDIGSTIADAGLVDMPNGKRYLIAMLVQRPHNDPNAEELIRQVSGKVYQSLSAEAVSSQLP